MVPSGFTVNPVSVHSRVKRTLVLPSGSIAMEASTQPLIINRAVVRNNAAATGPTKAPPQAS